MTKSASGSGPTGGGTSKRSRGAADAPDSSTQEGFEACAIRLEAVVDELEGGDLPLERSLELFEEGVRLARQARSTLDAAERRVQELLAVDEDGQPVTRELEIE